MTLKIARHKEFAHTGKLVLGYNADIDASATPETVWTPGGQYAHPGSAAVISLVSTSASDTQTVTVTGLSATYTEITETVTLTGLTPATTTATFTRVNALQAAAAAVGVITGTIGGTTVAQLPVGEFTHQAAIYTVPLGYRAYITKVFGSVQKNKDIHLDLVVKPFTGGEQLIFGVEIYESIIGYDFSVPIEVQAKSTIMIKGVSGASADTRVHAGFELILVQET